MRSIFLILTGIVLGAVSATLFAQHHGASHNPAHHGAHGTPGASMPVEAGEASFASVSEIVALLTADPDTDWSQVNITALRDHLIDMHRLMDETRVQQKNTDSGVVINVDGTPEGLAAASRMLPAHSGMLTSANGWTTDVTDGDSGLIWTVSSSDPAEVEILQGLGFYGIMATGAHHQPHHLAIATGRPMH